MQVLNATDKQIPLSVGSIVASVSNIDGAEIIAMDGQRAIRDPNMNTLS